MRMNRIAALTLGAGMITMAACSDAPTTAPAPAATIPSKSSFALGDVFALRAPLATELIVCKAGDVGGSFNLVIEAGESGAGVPTTVALPFVLNPGAGGVANCRHVATDVGDANQQKGDYFTVNETVAAGVTSSRVCYLNNGDLVPDGCPARFFINTAHGWTVVVTNVAPSTGCTYTKGWYQNKNGEPTIIDGVDGRSKADQIKIFNASPGQPGDVTWGTNNKPNNLLNLYQQLLAALNNVGNNVASAPSSVQTAINNALAATTAGPGTYIGLVGNPDIGALITPLSNFNEGLVAGWPHCD